MKKFLLNAVRGISAEFKRLPLFEKCCLVLFGLTMIAYIGAAIWLMAMTLPYIDWGPWSDYRIWLGMLITIVLAVHVWPNEKYVWLSPIYWGWSIFCLFSLNKTSDEE